MKRFLKIVEKILTPKPENDIFAMLEIAMREGRCGEVERISTNLLADFSKENLYLARPLFEVGKFLKSNNPEKFEKPKHIFRQLLNSSFLDEKFLRDVMNECLDLVLEFSSSQRYDACDGLFLSLLKKPKLAAEAAQKISDFERPLLKISDDARKNFCQALCHLDFDALPEGLETVRPDIQNLCEIARPVDGDYFGFSHRIASLMDRVYRKNSDIHFLVVEEAFSIIDGFPLDDRASAARGLMLLCSKTEAYFRKDGATKILEYTKHMEPKTRLMERRQNLAIFVREDFQSYVNDIIDATKDDIESLCSVDERADFMVENFILTAKSHDEIKFVSDYTGFVREYFGPKERMRRIIKDATRIHHSGAEVNGHLFQERIEGAITECLRDLPENDRAPFYKGRFGYLMNIVKEDGFDSYPKYVRKHILVLAGVYAGDLSCLDDGFGRFQVVPAMKKVGMPYDEYVLGDVYAKGALTYVKSMSDPSLGAQSLKDMDSIYLEVSTREEIAKAFVEAVGKINDLEKKKEHLEPLIASFIDSPLQRMVRDEVLRLEKENPGLFKDHEKQIKAWGEEEPVANLVVITNRDVFGGGKFDLPLKLPKPTRYGARNFIGRISKRNSELAS